VVAAATVAAAVAAVAAVVTAGRLSAPKKSPANVGLFFEHHPHNKFDKCPGTLRDFYLSDMQPTRLRPKRLPTTMIAINFPAFLRRPIAIPT
jgi:hypothetical protein